MSLINKLKKFPKVALLTAALSLPFVGCATTNSWQEIGTGMQPVGTQRTITSNIGTKSMNERIFTIGQINSQNPYDVIIPVKESLKRQLFQFQKTQTVQDYQPYSRQSKFVTKYDSTNAALFLSGLGLIGFGGLFGLAFDDYNNKITLGSALVGTSLTILSAFPYSSTETQNVPLGNPETKIVNQKINQIPESNPEVIYENKPSINTNVWLNYDSRNLGYVQTDKNGIVRLNVAQSLRNAGSNLIFSKYMIGNNLQKYVPLINEVRSDAREYIEQDLENRINESNIEVYVSTEEQSTQTEKVSNDSKEFTIPTYSIPSNAIYDAVNDYVNRFINPRIQKIDFSVKNKLTHLPIGNSNIVLNTSTIPKFELAGRYFTQDLEKYAEQNIKNYESGKDSINNVASNFSLPFYLPSRVSLEVTHSGYDYVDGILDITKNNPLTVYMVDVGTKVRIAGSGGEGYIQ